MWIRRRNPLPPSEPPSQLAAQPDPLGYEALSTSHARALPRRSGEPTLEIVPRDPVAYPRYPTRPKGAARPIYHIESEPVESGTALPVLPPRRSVQAVRRSPEGT